MTRTEYMRLRYINRAGEPFHGIRERTGGAVCRMLERMNEKGWINPVKWELTRAGKFAMRAYEAHHPKILENPQWV